MHTVYISLQDLTCLERSNKKPIYGTCRSVHKKFLCSLQKQLHVHSIKGVLLLARIFSNSNSKCLENFSWCVTVTIYTADILNSKSWGVSIFFKGVHMRGWREPDDVCLCSLMLKLFCFGRLEQVIQTCFVLRCEFSKEASFLKLCKFF